MLPLIFCEQGATAPVGQNGGITMTQVGTQWKATPWFGGTNLGGITLDRQIDAYQRAMAVLCSYIVETFYGAADPNN